MQILPDNDSKLVPVALFVLALFLIYFLGFHWFVERQLTLGSEINQQTESYQSFMQRADQRPILASQLNELQNNTQNAIYFRAETNVNSAAASMTNRLKQVITAEAEDVNNCQVISNQNVQQKNQAARFPKVTVSIRMRCSLDDFVRVLHKLEGDVPLVFVDDVNIYQRTVRRNRGRNNAEQPVQRDQDIRFNMSAYLKE